MIVLDTNVVSELMKPRPDESVSHWVLTHQTRVLCATAVTIAEILYGIERLPEGSRKELLRGSATEVFESFQDQVLPFDNGAAVKFSSIVSNRDRIGLPISGFDAQIASICRSQGAGLATRNVKDFEHTGIDTIDPWSWAF